ncbi:hypothetical protein G7Y79_00036g071700 [Physcia stellaris]|nr:hypothetical protein G7Y79_00036g071700 [Physcia stellaris]
MESLNVAELIERLGSEEDAVRKMAVFKLQTNIGDPSFADVFISEGGLTKLRYLTLHASGNTLAYSLTSLSRLLEVDKGWEYVNQDLVERVVELVVTHPLVNILRGAMSILVAVVSHPHTSSTKATQPDSFGFAALKPAIGIYPQFLEMLVSRLSSADHALCANALQLINSLMREAITNDSEADWPKFIKRLQDLGVIKAVYALMQSTALQDLAHPILEFQGLEKVLLRKWRNVPLEMHKSDHRRALKCLHLASKPEPVSEQFENGDDSSNSKHRPDKWRRLGFESETPKWEFEDTGYLGMMDLTNYVRKHEDSYQKILLEQSTRPWEDRCPIARASLAVTALLYEHFEVEKSDPDDAKGYLALESRSGFDRVFKPLLLQWPRLHVAGLQAFIRLWKATGAKREDFSKIADLVRVLIEVTVGPASRTKDLKEVEDEMEGYQLSDLRKTQMEFLELTYEGTWGHHLRQVKDELNHEAVQFVKEQRIRCLLQGAWFPNGLGYKAEAGPVTKQDLKRSVPSSYRFVRLSHNRRYLHYADFDSQSSEEPELEALNEKIDLSTVSSVVSNVSTSSPSSSTSTLTPSPSQPTSSTKITIHSYQYQSSLPSPVDTRTNSGGKTLKSHSSHSRKEITLLTLYPQSHSLASEWLDGLLMLLNQQPITKETSKLIQLVSNYGLKIRLLNVRFDDPSFLGEEPEIPSREGLDEDYYYDVFGGA